MRAVLLGQQSAEALLDAVLLAQDLPNSLERRVDGRQGLAEREEVLRKRVTDRLAGGRIHGTPGEVGLASEKRDVAHLVETIQ